MYASSAHIALALTDRKLYVLNMAGNRGVRSAGKTLEPSPPHKCCSHDSVGAELARSMQRRHTDSWLPRACPFSGRIWVRDAKKEALAVARSGETQMLTWEPAGNLRG